MPLAVGDHATTFRLSAATKQTISLQDLAGKSIVLYCSPKDTTPGCTKEACDVRNSTGAIHDAGTEVIGVSADSL